MNYHLSLSHQVQAKIEAPPSKSHTLRVLFTAGLGVQGGLQLRGAEIEGYNDHRIAMAFSTLGLKVPGMIIKDEKCVEKSFVNFYEVFQKIGGQTKPC